MYGSSKCIIDTYFNFKLIDCVTNILSRASTR